MKYLRRFEAKNLDFERRRVAGLHLALERSPENALLRELCEDQSLNTEAFSDAIDDWEKEYKLKQSAAHRLVAEALSAGILDKAFWCAECKSGSSKLVAHHCDYDKPLTIVWLCESCHGKWHSQHGSATVTLELSGIVC